MRAGGLENAAVYDVCTNLLAVIAAFPPADDFEERIPVKHCINNLYDLLVIVGWPVQA